MTIALGPSAGRFHFKATLTDRTAMGSKCLIILLIPWIDGDIRISLQLLDDKGIKFPDIIGLVTKEQEAFFELVSAFEFSKQFKGDFLIGDVIGQGYFNKRKTFL